MSDATLTVKVVASDQSDKFGTLCQLHVHHKRRSDHLNYFFSILTFKFNSGGSTW